MQDEPVPDRELQKVRNQVVADNYRRLQNNFFLMIQLGYIEALGGWEYINESSRRLLAVTTDDIVRVANTYFDPSNRVVGIYRRKEGAPRGDPALATMDPAQRQMVQQAMAQLAQAPPEQLGLILMTLEAQAAQAPPEAQPVLAYLADWIRDRMEAPTPGADDEDGNGGAP